MSSVSERWAAVKSWRPPRRPASSSTRAPRPSSAPPAGILGGARVIVLWLSTLLTLGASGVALWESYSALYQWAMAHHAEDPRLWPACVDAFILIGECALFLAMVSRWQGWSRVWPWIVVTGGLSVSVAANMGHAGYVMLTDRLTFAVPPLSAFVGLTVALGILKRVVLDAAAASSTTAAAAPSSPARARHAAAPRPSTTPPRSPAAATVAKLVGKGVTETAELAQLTGLAERTARRYAAEARGQQGGRPLEPVNGYHDATG